MFSQRRNGPASLIRACNNVINRLHRPAIAGRFTCEVLEDRRLLSGTAPALVASTTVLPFNASVAGYQYGGPSRVESVTLTNNGNGYLLFDSGAFSIVGNPSATTSTPSAFKIVNSSSLPTQLAPGQSTTVQLQYTPTILGLQSAILAIGSNDPTTPTFDIDLNGIGTHGEFGTAEPSLVQVLRAYDIPTIVGAGPNDANINVQKYPASPDPSSQEVPMQRMVAANSSLPVTITPIASFSSATAAVSRIGYYTPGNPNATTELFYVAKADAQTVQPSAVGPTSFDPGTATFSLYGSFPGTTISTGLLDTHYSEDALNTLDPTSPRKIRFFPMKTPDGTVVPNSYIVAMEDYNDPTQYNSFINFLGIISNVTAAPNAAAGSVPSSTTGNNPPVMGVQLNQTAPGSNNLVFNTIKTPNSIVADVVHNENTVTINNTGDQPLVINSLTLSDTKNWQLVNPPAAGTAIPGDSSLTLTIKFIATTDPPHTTNETNDTTSQTLVSPSAAGGVWSGTLTINSNAPVNPTSTVNLRGWWQIQSEHENEPSVSTLTSLMFGYTTTTTGSSSSNGTEYPNGTGAYYGTTTPASEGAAGNTVITYPGEVDPSTDQGLLIAADPTQPVSLIEAAAFHQQYVTVSATVGTTGEAIADESETDNTVTITTAAATTFVVGNTVTIAGDVTGYDGTFTITAVPTTNTFTYTDTTTDLPDSATAVTQPQSGWFPVGGHTKFLFKDQPNNGQSVLPLQTNDSYSTVETSFSPTGAFGLNLDGEKSEDSLNTDNIPFDTSGHGLRFWPAIDANGNTVPNTYIVGLDYKAYADPNSDYQDLYEIVSNVTFEALPPTPLDLQATEGISGVNLQWVPMNGATGYNVYQVVNGTKTLLTTTPTTATKYTDATAPTGTAIQYQVVAVNSASVNSVPATTSITVAAAIPAAPTIQSADGSSTTQVALTWSSVSGATSYIVSREGPGQTSYQQIATNVTATSYNDANVTAGQTYSYIVQADNSAGPSPDSAAATATVTEPQLAAPMFQSADGSSGTAVTLVWTSVTGATTYTIQREAPGQSSYTQYVTGLNGTSYTDSAVTAGDTYQYIVSAQNGANSSPGSAPISGTVKSTIPTLTAPTGLTADTSSGTSIALSWNASAGAATYTLERETVGASSFQQIAGGITTASYTDANVVVGDTYEYAVEANNGSNSSAFSNPPVHATLTTQGGVNTVSVNVGKGNNKYVQFTDVDGTLTVIKMTGSGVTTVTFIGDSVVANTFKSGIVTMAGTDIAIQSISTTGTNGGSGVMLTTRGGNGTVNIGSMTTDASLGSIAAKTATLIGGLMVAGSVSKISLGSANAASISAGSIGALTINGNATLNLNTAAVHAVRVRGTLSGSTLTLTLGGAIDLAMLSAGAISDSTINAIGDIGTVTAGSLSGSLIYAGVASTGSLPSLASDFSASDFIGSVMLKKRIGVASDVNSSIAASLVKHASLGYVQFANNGTAFGVAAQDVNSVTFADASVGKSYTFTKLTAESLVTADLAAKGIAPQDFVIRIV